MRGDRFRRTLNNIVRNIPKNQRLDVLTSANKVLPSDAKTYKKVFGIKILSFLPKGHRTLDSHPEFKKLILDMRGEKISERLADTVGRINSQQRLDVIEKAENLFPHADTRPEKVDIIRRLEYLPEGHRTPTNHRYFKELFKGLTYRCYKEVIFSAVRKITEEDRLDVIVKASQLFTENMAASTRADVLVAISKIPEKQRADVINSIKTLLTSGLNEKDMAYTLNAVHNIPDAQRTNVIHTVQKMLTENTTSIEVVDAIKVVSNIVAQVSFSTRHEE